jgi:hypothetical protein
MYVMLATHALSGAEAVARVAPQPLPEPGRLIGLAIDLTKLHFFDQETEDALTETPAAATELVRKA